MDFQKFFDGLSEILLRERTKYHLTLGALRDALALASDNVPVVFDDGEGVGHADSYRGYFTDIAFCAGPVLTAAEMRSVVAKALTTTFEGYKGGEFPASPEKPLWRSAYGEASGIAIVNAEMRGGALVLFTKMVDD